MSESEEKTQLVDYDSEESFEKAPGLENAGQDPTLKIKIEKNVDTLHSLSQFQRGLIHITDENKPGSSKTPDENKDVKMTINKMNKFSTPVKLSQSTNIEEDKNENTKIKIISNEKMITISSKEIDELKMIMLQTNKQTSEIAASMGKSVQRLEDISKQLVRVIDTLVDGRKTELELAQAKLDAIKLEAEKKTNDGEETVKAQTAKFDGKKNCHRCAKPGHRIEDCPLPKDLWFCYYCQEVRSHKGSDCKDSRIKKNSVDRKK